MEAYIAIAIYVAWAKIYSILLLHYRATVSDVISLKPQYFWVAKLWCVYIVTGGNSPRFR